MGLLHDCVRVVEGWHKDTEKEVRRARGDEALGAEMMQKWNDAVAAVPKTHTFIGTEVPKVALPLLDEPGAVMRYLRSEGLPGEFPFTYSAYPTQYLIEEDAIGEEPTRMFAGLGLPEDTNQRFKLLSENQRSHRLSTAFDGPTLYGMDADDEGVLGKVGEGGVSVSTVDDMERLFDGFDLQAKTTSVSMTINGPAPILLAQFIAAAVKRELKSQFNGSKPDAEAREKVKREVMAKLRGTVQADILKEVQAQNETLFPIQPSLRLLGDMVAYTADYMPRWYPISISGYHIAEAGADPVEQLAFTVGNGIFYVGEFHRRKMDLSKVVPRLSFFFQFDYDLESAVIGRVARRIWSIALKQHFGIDDPRALRLKFHAQTSGRSLTEQGLLNNITRTATQLFLSLANNTNSAHSNAYDEAITTPTAEAARIASQTQALLLEETGLFRHMMGLFSQSPGMGIVTDQVEKGVLEVWEEMDRLGGVMAAIDSRYTRARIQDSFYSRQSQIASGLRHIVGVNCYTNPDEQRPSVELSRTPRDQRDFQAGRVREFKNRNSEQANAALGKLRESALKHEDDTNVFSVLVDAVEHASLGQIVTTLQDCWGKFRPMV